jgi:hypothetical protein
MIADEKRTSPLVLIVVWLIVGVPGAWGVEQTLRKSLDLFRGPAHTTEVPAIPTPGQNTPGH